MVIFSLLRSVQAQSFFLCCLPVREVMDLIQRMAWFLLILFGWAGDE
jgi:hypothetical protein